MDGREMLHGFLLIYQVNLTETGLSYGKRSFQFDIFFSSQGDLSELEYADPLIRPNLLGFGNDMGSLLPLLCFHFCGNP
jgi:hypothetical protein